jgi:predicted ATPase/class 3 adenylate cyclase
MAHTNPSESTGQRFGDLLRTLRRASGLTQAELAERAKLSIRGLSDLERGVNRSPRRETLLALANALALAETDRARFIAASRRHPAVVSASSSLPPSTALGSQPNQESAGQADPVADIHVFLIADVRGYTSYTYEHGDEDAAQLALRFATLATAAVEAHSGHVLEVRGDEVLAVFSSARAALRAAIALQEQVEQASQATPNQPIRCGIGVEAGEAVPVPGGYRGLALNLAARLCAKAGPGEVLAGETVIGLVRKVDGLRFQDRGVASLKGFADPVRITQVLAVGQPQISGEPEASTSQAEQIQPPRGEHASLAGKAVGNYLSAHPRHRLVAREKEMAQLLAVLAAVQQGTGRLVEVVGEPGVGKTRLAQEVLQAAREHGFVGLTGRCYAPQETVPYYPFLEALTRAYTAASQAIRTALPQQWPEVARLIPDQRLALPIPPAAHFGSGSADDQQRLFWQITRFLQALSDEHPLALLLDDLHWMDGASVELLLHLARNTRESPILLLGTYRDSEVPRSHPLAAGLQDLGRAHLVERIELQPLPREGTAALLAATLEEGEVSEAVTDVIYGPTEGNAFFVQEVLQALLERGDVTLEGGCWQTRHGADILVPESIRAAVLERVGRLSPSGQEALTVASVLGQTFRFDDLLATWTALTPTPVTVSSGSQGEVSTSTTSEQETTLEEALEEAVRARVLREVGGERYVFSHVLAQRALYEQLSIRRRRRMHRAAAERLEQLVEPERIRRVSDMAYHFLQADDSARALPYILQAGEQALAVYAHPEAERQFRTALDLARQLGDAEVASVAQEQLGQALFNQGRFDEASSVLEQAVTEAEHRGALTRLVHLTWLQSYADAEGGAGARGIPRLLRLIETIRAQGASPELVWLYLSLGACYYASRLYADELDATEHALEVAQAIGDAGLVLLAQQQRGQALLRVGRLEEAAAELAAVVAVLQDRERKQESVLPLVSDLEVDTLHNLGFALMQLDRLEEAHAYYERGLAVAEQKQFSAWVASQSAACGWTAFLRGDWLAARRYIERALTLEEQIGPSLTRRPFVYLINSFLQLALGQLQAATQSAETGLALAEQRSELMWVWWAQRLLAETDLERGDPAAASARLSPLLHRANIAALELDVLLPVLVWAQLESGEVEVAEHLLAQTCIRLRAQHHRFYLVDALRVEAAVCIQRQRWDEAKAALQEVLTLACPMPYPYAEAKALDTYGDLLVACGQPDQAREQYAAALAILHPLREVPYAKRIERALAEMARH